MEQAPVISEEQRHELFYTAPEVQDIMGWSRATLYRRISDGDFPAGTSTPGSREKRWTMAQLEEHLDVP